MSWRHCSSCRADIDFGMIHWRCSVSTCNSKRTGLFFCSVSCWEAHLPSAHHREAWAVEERAPSQSQWQAEQADQAEKSERRAAVAIAREPEPERPLRRTISPTKNEAGQELPRDVLVVVSKLKNYVKARAGMKTSDTVIPVLSDELRKICDRAIRIATERGRKTILDRDVRDALKD